MNYRSIFRIIDLSLTGITNKFGVFNKSLSDVIRDMRNGQGVAKSFLNNLVYKNGLSKNDVKQITSFIQQCESGTPTVKAWNNTMLNASANAKRAAKDIKMGKASLDDITYSANNSRLAMLGATAATTALNVALTLGISLAIQGVIQLVDYWAKSQERANEAVKDAAQKLSELKNELKSLDDYKDKISSLRDELDKGNLSLGDANKKREELLTLQDELIDKYGKEEGAVKNIRAAILGEVDALDQLSKQQMDKWLTNNKDAIATAKKYANESIGVSIGAYYNDDPEISRQIRDAAISLGFAGAVYEGSSQKDALGFGGTREEIINKMSKFREWLRQYCRDNNVSTDIRDYFLNGLDDQENYITDKNADDGNFNNQMSVYRKAIEYEIAVNHSELYESLTRSKKQYEDAIISGDTQLAKTAYDSFQKTIKDFGEKIKNGDDSLTDAETAYIVRLKNDLENELSPVLKIDLEGTKREFDSSYEKMTEIYAKVGNEGFKFDKEGFDVLEHYNEVLKEAKALGVDEDKTVFGNIDTGNRQVLEWTEENLNKYKDAYESLGWTAEELKGTISTVMGVADEFDGVNIAFTPMLQTDHGAVLLDKNTVYEYIWALIDQMPEGWTNEDLLKLDVKGIEMDGQKIKGLIADIGDTAIKTSESMHFVGKDGAIADAYKYWQEYIKENNLFGISVEQASEFNAIRDAAKEAGVSIEEYINALEDFGYITKENSDDTSKQLATFKTIAKEIEKYQKKVKTLKTALDKIKTDKFTDEDELALINDDQFPDMIKYAGRIKEGIQSISSKETREIIESLLNIDVAKLSDEDTKSYQALLDLIYKINDGLKETTAQQDEYQNKLKTQFTYIQTLQGFLDQIKNDGNINDNSLNTIMTDNQYSGLRNYIRGNYDVDKLKNILSKTIVAAKDDYKKYSKEYLNLIEGTSEKESRMSFKTISDMIERFKKYYDIDEWNWKKLAESKKSIIDKTQFDLYSKVSQYINQIKSLYDVDITNFKNAEEAKYEIAQRFRTKEDFHNAVNLLTKDNEGHISYDEYSGRINISATQERKNEVEAALKAYGLDFWHFEEFLNSGRLPELDNIEEIFSEIVEKYFNNSKTVDLSNAVSTSKNGGSYTKESSQQIDWIERYIKKYTRETKDAVNAVTNAVGLNSKSSSLLEAINATRTEISAQNNAYSYYMREANSIALDEAWKRGVREGYANISTITDTDLKDKISQYQSLWDKANSCKDAVDQLKDSEKSLEKQRIDNINNYYDQNAKVIDRAISRANDSVDDTRKYIKNYADIEKFTNDAIASETSRRQNLINERAFALNNGLISINDDDYNNLTNQIEEATDKISKYEKDIRNLAKEKFDDFQKWYDNQVKARIDSAERLSKVAEDETRNASKNYNQIRSKYRSAESVYNKQAEEMQKILNEAVSTGKVQKGSTEWYNMSEAISKAKDSVSEMSKIIHGLAVEELTNLKEKWDENAENIDKSISRQQKLAESNDKYNIRLRNKENAELKIQNQLLAENRNKRAILQKERIAIQNKINAMVKNGDLVANSKTWKEWQSVLKDIDLELIDVDNEINNISDSIRDIPIKQFEYIAEIAGKIRDMLESVQSFHASQGLEETTNDIYNIINITTQQISKLRKETSQLLNEMISGKYGEIGSDDYTEALDKYIELNNSIYSLMSEQEQEYDKLVDKSVDDLNKQKEELQKQNDELEKRLALEKAIQALENARYQKNKLIYREGVGFRYEADQNAIRDAQEDLDKQYRESILDKFDKTIDALEDFKKLHNLYTDDGQNYTSMAVSDKNIDTSATAIALARSGAVAKAFETIDSNLVDLYNKSFNTEQTKALLNSYKAQFDKTIANQNMMYNLIADRNKIQNPINLTIAEGAINLNGVKDPDALSKAIISQLPNQIIQDLNKI